MDTQTEQTGTENRQPEHDQQSQPYFKTHPKAHKTAIFFTGVCIVLAAISTVYFALQAQRNNFPPHTLFAPAITPTPTPIVIKGTPIHEGNIALLEGNIVSLVNTSTMIKTKLNLPKLDYPQTITFSPDGNTLFTGDTTLFVIYNMRTKKFISLPNLSPNPRVETSDDVSPNNKYFVLTQSCCPGDVGKAIMDFDGKFLLQQTGQKTAWSPDGSQLAISKGEVQIHLPLGPFPTNNSLYVETVSNATVSAKLLLKATSQASYTLVSWIDNNTLLYEKTLFSQPFPANLDPNDTSVSDYWMKILNSPTKTYHTINVRTHIIKNITYQQPSTVGLLSGDGKWSIVVDGKGSIFGPTYLLSSDKKQKIKISNYGLAVWQPHSH